MGGDPDQIWTGGYPRLPPSQGWSTPPLSGPGMGYPPSEPGVGYSPHNLGWSTPSPCLDLGWGTSPPCLNNRRSTCYAAVGIPLAFTQEDFLVSFVYSHRAEIRPRPEQLLETSIQFHTTRFRPM